MKKITSILAFVLALTWVSCNKETIGSINEITDHYTVPEGAVELTSLSKSESTWSLDRRYFDLAFTGNGATLETRLVAFDALLAPFEYVLGADEIGNAIAANTKLNGQSVNTGYVLVTKKDKDYQVIANLDGKAFVWTGSFPFTQDPEPLVLSVVQQAQANKDNKLVTMQLATEGISQEFDMRRQVPGPRPVQRGRLSPRWSVSRLRPGRCRQCRRVRYRVRRYGRVG